MKFKKTHSEVQTLIDSDGEINVMTSAYAAVLRLHIYLIDLRIKKIDRSKLLIHNMALTNFQIEEK